VVDTDIVKQILSLIPQQPPFRFVDSIIHVDEKKIWASYRFRKNEYFYKGHFPQYPITPGVILIETMAQAGVVAHGIYLLLHQGYNAEQIRKMTILFTFVDAVEFCGIVHPGERVMIHGEKMYIRKGNLKSKTAISRKNGNPICSAVLTGTGVEIHEK